MVLPLDHIRLEAGALLFLEGGPGDCAYLITQGEVEIFTTRAGEAFVLARRRAGEIIGEMALIDSGLRSASVRATTDCEFIIVTARQIQHRIAQTDPILRMCLDVVIDRYRQTLELYSGRAEQVPAPRAEKSVGNGDLNRAIMVLTLEHELELAIHRQEFELYFQPIIDLATYELAGFEALIRWNHPRRGVVMPGDFIPVAEASGLIVGITAWCLREVAQTFPRLLAQAGLRAADAGLVPRSALFISVNVSGHDLLDAAFDGMVQTILDEGGIRPEDLKLEITESVLMKDPQRAAIVLQACRQRGIGIAIDDFGTGYSSLSYLSTLPITTLKIDRTFVQGIAQDGPSRKIARTIRYLASELEIPVVAEGIETEAQAEALAALACEYGQGYLFGRPVPLSDTLDLIAHWSARPPAQRELMQMA